MSKKQKKTTEDRYERICREYVERDELEKLNARASERVYQMERMMAEREQRAEEIRQKQEQRFCAAVKLVFLAIMALTIVSAVLVLAYTEAIAWWISITVAVLLTIPSAFKAGWFWYEFKH